MCVLGPSVLSMPHSLDSDLVIEFIHNSGLCIQNSEMGIGGGFHGERRLLNKENGSGFLRSTGMWMNRETSGRST